MSHPARGPRMGIDGKANAAWRRTNGARTGTYLNEASRMSLPLLALWIAMVALIGGCTTPGEPQSRRESPWYQVVVEPTQNDSDRALRFYDRLLKLKGAELAQELDIARQAFEKDKSELNRVQLAMLLSLPGTSFRDDHTAYNLLQPFARDKGFETSVLRPLAVLLYMELAELRRLDEALQQQTAKTRDEQRRAEALQQKLEAILEMEMKMIEREQAAPPRRR